MKLTLEMVQQREALNREGYLVAPQVTDETVLGDLLPYSEGVINNISIMDFQRTGSLGRTDCRHPAMTAALTNPKTLDILSNLGYSRPKLHSAFFTTKHIGALGLGWHSDVYYDFETTAPTELFLLTYFEDVSPDNGCLRVTPGSHRWPRAQEGLGSKSLKGEVDVPMRAGDLFIGDRRLWHATHPNSSNKRRTALTVAMAPDFANLPENIQARIVAHQGFKGWWPSQAGTLDPQLEAILPIYNGTAKPIKMIWEE